MTTVFTPVADVDARTRAAMLALMDRHFAGVDAQTFAADLAGKSHVLRLIGSGGELLGFTTMLYRRDGDRAVVYSGDTIVDTAAWSDARLGSAGLAAALDLHRRSGGGVLWWLLLTSGVRTHRYLRVFCRRYHPAPAAVDDPEAAELLPALARRRFGEAFDAATGVVRFPRPQRLRPHLAVVPAHLAHDEATRLFLARNPGWAAGDELVSLGRLDEGNLTRAGLRSLATGRSDTGAAR